MNAAQVHIIGAVCSRMGPLAFNALNDACTENNLELSQGLNETSIVQHLKTHPHDMLLADIKTLAELVENQQFEPNEQTLAAIFERYNPEFATFQSKGKHLRYLVSARHPALLRASLSAIFRFRFDQHFLGIPHHIINKDHKKVYRHKLKSSSERTALQNATIDFFSKELENTKNKHVLGNSSYPKYMGDILDELLMNAIWDANEKRAHTDRTHETNLDSTEQVIVEAECDHESFVLSVTDSQGSFPELGIQKPLKYALGFRDEIEINEGSGGAGLGLYMTLQKAALLSFEVERGKYTRVTVVQRMDQPLTEMQRWPRTVLFFLK